MVANQVRWLNGTLSGNMTSYDVLTYGVSQGDPNCIQWEKPDVWRILGGGYVKAEWTARNLASEHLSLIAYIEPYPKLAGPSPLTMEIPAGEAPEAGFGVGLQNAEPGGAIIDQPIRLEWSIPYLGTAEPTPIPTYC